MVSQLFVVRKRFFRPERATHLSPGQGVLAAALGFKAPKTISRPVRARKNRVALPLQGGYIHVVHRSQGVALG